MNKDLIIKNLSGILCAVCVVALILPFCSASVSANVGGISADSEASVNGIKMVTSGLWGILFIVGLVVVLGAAYLKQLAIYRKILQLVASGVMVLTLFMSPAAALSGGAEAGGDSSSVDIDISYGIGFWIILACSLALAGLAVISFFNLKGNVVFDTLNTENDDEATPINTPDFGAAAQKIGDLTKNIAGNLKNKVSKSDESVSEPHQSASVVQQPAPAVQQPAPAVQQPAPAVQQPAPAVQQPAPVVQQPAPVVQQPTPAVRQAAPTVQQPNVANADYYMEQLEKLFAMKEKGVLTEEEFAQKKKEYLKKM